MIRWITQNLGTAAYNDAITISEDFEIVDVRNLVDKEGNTSLEIQKKIDEALLLLESKKRVVVCCDYGMSRSNSIAAGILARYENISIASAVKKVMGETGEREIKLEMLQSLYSWADASEIQHDEMRILITGASGFIGSELVKRLDDLLVITPTSSELDISKDHVQLDMLVKEIHINTIVHLANPRIYTTYDAFGKSLTMLKTVMDVCVTNNIRLVFLSSWVIFGGYKGSVFANETLSPIAKDSYGHTKLLAEELIKSYVNNKNLSVMILRPCSIYGAGKDSPKFIWNFIDKCRKNQDIVTHQYINGSPRLDLLHVHDLVSAIEIAVRSGDVGTYNVGGGLSVSTDEVASILIEKTGATSKLSHSIIDDYTANITLDSTRFSKKYGWSPQITLEDGLDELLNL